MYTFGPFADPVDVTELVDYVRDQLGYPIMAMDDALKDKKVVLPVQVKVPRERVLRFLTWLIEAKGSTLYQAEGGIYVIQQLTDVQSNLGESPFNTTQIIPTRGLKPTSLQSAIVMLGIPAQQAGPGQMVGKGATAISYLDELGVIIVTATPRAIAQIVDLVDRLAEESANIRPIRFELRHVAASYAREQVLVLLGIGTARGAGRAMTNPNQQQTPQAAIAAAASSLLPFEERLTIDPQGNALWFRGRPDEIGKLQSHLAIVDVPNALSAVWYPVGTAARAIANEGQKLGLGDVAVEEGTAPTSDPQAALRLQQVQAQQALQAPGAAGPGFIIYPDSGGFMYRGTREQHERVAALVKALAELTNQDLVVIEFYKLKHSKAEDVAEIVQNILTNQVSAGSSPLVQTDLRGRGQARTAAPAQPRPAGQPGEPDRAGGSLEAITGNPDTFVLPDKANNQVVVKAPKRLQPQFARLIEKLDLRRPQVYVDVKIIAITASDNFRLAFETQLLSGDFNWNTNFGLGTFPQNSSIDAKKSVVDTLLGATAAYIRSDQVPLIVTALAQNVDTRILSSPQLLVDDNEEASVDSVDRQPYSQTQQTSGNPLVTSFGGEAEAGTKLKIKPQISEGDYLKLDYEVELSSFTGQSASAGVPPPSQVNKISAKSVTVPSDTTIVVGGLQFEQVSETIFKVPFIGDIPIIGQVFRDQRKDGRKGTLYVFITPRIMKDPTFNDLRLLSRGPMQTADLPREVPPPEPVRIEILEPGRPAPAPPSPAPPLAQPSGARS